MKKINVFCSILVAALLINSGCLPSDRQKDVLQVMDHYMYKNFIVPDLHLNGDLNRSSFAFPKRRYVLNSGSENKKVSLVQFLKLYRCELSRLLAEQSNSMQQLRDSEEQFFYAVEFIYLGAICLSNRKNKDDPLAQVLLEAVSAKTHTLPSIFAGSLMRTPEAANFFSSYGKPVFSRDLREGVSEFDFAIKRLLHWRRHAHGNTLLDKPDLKVMRSDIYGVLALIRREKYAGRVLVSAHQLTLSLSRINAAIVGSQALLCQPEAKRHFDKKVLPELNVILEWGRIIRQLAPIFEDLPEALGAYRKYWRSHWAAEGGSTMALFEQSLSEHGALLAVGAKNSDCSS